MAVSIIDLPVALPHKCASCGCSTNHDGRKYLDFGISIDFYGVLYICSQCIVPLMNSHGWLSPDQSQELKEANAKLQLEALELRGKCVSYGNALKHFIDNDQLGMDSGIVGSSPTVAKNDSGAKSSDKKRGSDSVSAISSGDKPIITI